MVLEYEGTRFHGFGLQPGLRTVQGVLEDTLAAIMGDSVRVTPGGRTDAGVHALGQVVSFRMPQAGRLSPRALARAANALLPDDVAVRAAEAAPTSFDARRSAIQRHYRYAVWNGPQANLWARRTALHHAGALDVAAMQRAADLLLGRRDFASFIGHQAEEPRARTTVRTLTRADWGQDGDFLFFDCGADGFGRHMVRGIVGTLLQVGQGRVDAMEIPRLLAARDRRAAGPTAPSHGLTLMRIDYPDSIQCRSAVEESRSC